MISTYGHKIRACEIANDTLHGADAHVSNKRNQPPAQHINQCKLHKTIAYRCYDQHVCKSETNQLSLLTKIRQNWKML